MNGKAALEIKIQGEVCFTITPEGTLEVTTTDLGASHTTNIQLDAEQTKASLEKMTLAAISAALVTVLHQTHEKIKASGGEIIDAKIIKGPNDGVRH